LYQLSGTIELDDALTGGSQKGKPGLWGGQVLKRACC